MTPLEEPGLRIMVATRPVDFRRGHDGLAAYAQIALGFAPTRGLVLVFRPRRGDRLKILCWDSNGIIMSYKRMTVAGWIRSLPSKSQRSEHNPAAGPRSDAGPRGRHHLGIRGRLERFPTCLNRKGIPSGRDF